MDESQSIDLIKKTVRLAHDAREKYLSATKNAQSPLIAASIGPYGAHLHDGSEYSGSYAETVSPNTIKDWHRRRIAACIEAGVDLLAIETIPCLVRFIFDYIWLDFISPFYYIFRWKQKSLLISFVTSIQRSNFGLHFNAR